MFTDNLTKGHKNSVRVHQLILTFYVSTKSSSKISFDYDIHSQLDEGYYGICLSFILPVEISFSLFLTNTK